MYFFELLLFLKETDEYNEDIMEKLLIFLEQGVRDGK